MSEKLVQSNLVKIPKRFHIDCEECDCPVPVPVRETKNHYFISTEQNERMDELISRSLYYAETVGFDEGTKRTLCQSARATLKSLHKANVLDEYTTQECRKAFGYPPYDMRNQKDRIELGYDT